MKKPALNGIPSLVVVVFNEVNLLSRADDTLKITFPWTLLLLLLLQLRCHCVACPPKRHWKFSSLWEGVLWVLQQMISVNQEQKTMR